ncbi:uncharacterized protein LOC131238896 [Magnolia sinica]|uniref:uncharacterized protein LOC131238896 n=1 Tax=Magnolia sinica TaxID=86752 RepID=UPI00265A517E|nr:uncharacterized protein LOC131238896 [Magnolia sinica]
MSVRFMEMSYICPLKISIKQLLLGLSPLGDVIGPINPPSSKEKQYILAVTDYFSKWSEAIALHNVKEKDMVNFIQHAIIYRHNIPKKIVTDNGTPFKNRGMEKLCQKFSIHHSFSTPYYPPANGLAEVFNKTIVKILKKTVTGTSVIGMNSCKKHCEHIGLPTGQQQDHPI